MTYCGPRNQDTRIEYNNFHRYTMKTVESGTFRFSGREMIQNSVFLVSVKCKYTTEKIEPLEGRKQKNLARDHEIAQVKFVVKFLA